MNMMGNANSEKGTRTSTPTDTGILNLLPLTTFICNRSFKKISRRISATRPLPLFTMNSLAVLVRRAALQPSTGRLTAKAMAAARQSVFSFSSQAHVEEVVPKEDYVNGHLITDHLEYMEDMLDVTLRMEQSMQDLQEIYDEKRQALADMSEMVEIDALFEKSASKKALLSSQIAELKAVLANARAYASDAPDGTSDAEIREGVREANRIINDAAKIEDADAIRKQRAFDRAVQADRARDTEHDW
jgi:hypothetical protein